LPGSSPHAADLNTVGPSSLSLSDSEMLAVMQAARPIDPRERDQFLRDVAVELSKYELLGPGVIDRAVAKVQKQHLAPRTGHHVGSNWG
jgi:hypothetical protein